MSDTNNEIKLVNNEKTRHSFTTFWLYFGLIINSIFIILYFFFQNTIRNYIGLTSMRCMIAGVCSIILGLGYSLLLKWKKIGFWLIISVAVINIIIYCIIFSIGTGKFYFETDTIVGSIIGPIILFFILKIKKNDKSTWMQLK